MTRTMNARTAGVTFLLYIAAGIASLALAGRGNATEIFSVLTSFSALVLGVTLYAITREQDPDLAMLGLVCRVVESMSGDGGAVYFAVGSTIFCWLLLSGRMIPVILARLGVSASVLLVGLLLLQRAGVLGGVLNWSSTVTWFLWLPMLVFELAFSAWLLTKGVAAPEAGLGRTANRP